MQVIGPELARWAVVAPGASVKFILGDALVVFFPAARHHCEVKVLGLSYDDDSRGNAVAGLLVQGRVEIRFHAAYSDDRIRRAWARVRAARELAGVDLGRLYYQGREIR